MLGKEFGTVRNEQLGLDEESKERLTKILTEGDIYEMFHSGMKELPPNPKLLHLTPHQAETLVSTTIFSKKQLAVLRVKIRREEMSLLEVAGIFGISVGAAYGREYGIISRLEKFFSAISEPGIQIFLFGQGLNNEPGVVLRLLDDPSDTRRIPSNYHLLPIPKISA